MIKLPVFTFGLLTATLLNAQSPTLQWVKSMGGTSVDQAKSIALDGFGNVYTTGYFYGIADFDPGPGVVNLGSIDSTLADIFVTKCDAFGNLVWAKQLGGALFEISYCIAIDPSGNVYTSGYFQGTADFDPGPGSFNLISDGQTDIFISKLDAFGNFIWAKQIGGTLSDESRSIAVDANGQVYTTGRFRGTVDFDPGPGTLILTAGGVQDPFICKLDASGNFVWAKQLEGNAANLNQGCSIAIDLSGNVLTTGVFEGTVDFDTGPAEFNLTTAGSRDIYISKLDVAGNFIWAKRIGGNISYSTVYAIAVDLLGNSYTNGSFFNTVDFDPGVGIFNLNMGGSAGACILKLDALGNFVWATAIGGTSYENGRSLAIDVYNNVYTTGGFFGTQDFDPGIETFSLSTIGNFDIFISKLDASGNFVWAQQMGGVGEDLGNSIAVSGSGNIYVTGQYSLTCDFDPGNSSYPLTSSGWQDVFVLKLNQNLGMSLNEEAETGNFDIYPNPGNGVYYFDLYSYSRIIVTNVLGEEILKQDAVAGRQIVDLQVLADGIYYINVIAENGRMRGKKIIKTGA